MDKSHAPMGSSTASTTALPSFASSPNKVGLIFAISQVAATLGHDDCLRPLAEWVGAEGMLLFIYDREVDAYLPPAILPQTMPDGLQWQAFLKSTSDKDSASSFLSPCSGKPTTVLARKLSSELILVALGALPHGKKWSQKWNEACSAGPILHALFQGSYHVQIVTAEAKLAREAAQDASLLAHNLLDARKKLEAALSDAQRHRLDLEHSNQLLRLAHQMAAMGVWEWDVVTDKVSLSEQVLRLHGFKPGAFKGNFHALSMTFHPEDRQRIGKAVNDALNASAPYDVEFRVVRPDGDVRWIAARANVERDAEGVPLKMVGFSMDINQRKRAEEALRISERLATVGRLSSTIAHEINNPLEGITNLLYLIGTAQSLPDDLRNYVAMAEREVERVSHIARQTLGFYRDTSKPVPTDLRALLDEILELYSPRFKRHSIQVEIRAENSRQVTALRGELKQLFSNLITNAIDAMPKGGQLLFSILDAGTHVAVKVSDSGHGIPQSQMARLFEPFFTTKEHVGTGLGLWISRELAEKHGGTITAESSAAEPGRGTTFTVTLSYEATNRGAMDGA